MLPTTLSQLVSRSPRGCTGIAVALFILILGACSRLNVSLPDVDVPDAVTAAFSGPDALKGRPLTSSVENAWPQASPLLDDWAPQSVSSLLGQPRTGDGGFRLSPGVYESVLQSFCLGVGTAASPGGLGFVAAALQGDRAGVVQAILRATSNRLDIEQRSVQLLLWAVVAGATFDRMSDRVQATALELLGQSDIRTLGRSIMDDVSQEAWERAVAELPPEAQRVFEAEARIRELVADAGSSYEDVERIAVRLGDPTPSDRDMPIPEGRWTRHPDGYLVRFFPINGYYTHARVQVAVPGGYTIERDTLGRVVAIDLGGGYRSEVSYDDSIDPPAHGGIAGVSAYLFREVRFMRPNPDRPGEIETVVIEPGGYAFQMVRGMGGGGRIGAEATPAKDPISKMSASSVWYSRDAPGSGPWVSPAFAHRTSEARAGWRSPLAQSTLRDWNRRIDQAQAFRERIDEYRGLRDWVDDPPPDDAIDELGNAQHYSDGLEAATRGTAAGLGWIGPQQQRQYDALRMAEEKLRTLPGDSEKSDDPGGRVVVVVVYAPSRDTGAPGSAESQFRGFSGR